MSRHLRCTNNLKPCFCAMSDASTRHLMHEDLESGLPATREYSPTFVAHAANDQRAPSTPLSLITGTGYHIYTSLIIPQILTATYEVILVTCFWAASATRDALHTALLELSAKAVSSSSRLRVHICFSTYSLARNLLLPTPKRGQNYGPRKWRKLGLPDASRIPGLELRVTRKFGWPWGIIHSKYVVIDREVAIFPSCNVSWERWLEDAISIRGPVVEHLLNFHTRFWENGTPLARLPSTQDSNSATVRTTGGAATQTSSISAPETSRGKSPNTALLPSPHTPSLLPPYLHPSTLLHTLPCLPSRPPTHPPTPLLTTTTHLLATACQSILMISPNVTAATVLAQLQSALSPPRSVNVTIWTNKNLMTAEQLVTAGTTTPRCMASLQKWYDAEVKRYGYHPSNNSVSATPRTGMGALEIRYFDGSEEQRVPKLSHLANSMSDVTHQSNIDLIKESTPVKLHAKITIIDYDKLLLGSGNMDAASWGTSQELGVLLEEGDIMGQLLNKELSEWLNSV